MSKIREWAQAIAEMRDAILIIAGIIAMVALAWATLWGWFTHLQIIQIILLGVVSLCLLVMFVTLFLSWWHNRHIQSIPVLLSQLNQMTLDWIEGYNPDAKGKAENLVDDLGKVLNLQVGQMKAAMRRKDKAETEKQFERMANVYQGMFKHQDKQDRKEADVNPIKLE